MGLVDRMPSKRIALTLHKYTQGGTDRVCCLLASGLTRAGYEVDLIAFCKGGVAEDSLTELLDEKVRRVYLGEASGSRKRDLNQHMPKAVAWLKEARPDCVISTGNSMHRVTAKSVRMAGTRETKLILKTTNPIFRPKDAWLARAVRTRSYRIAFEQADRILTLSDAETSQLRDDFPTAGSKFKTVINPYVTEAMLAPSTGVRSDVESDDRKLILGCGSLDARKRFDLLVRAFAQIADQNSRLVILGDGPAREELTALVHKLGPEGRVDLPGYVSDVAGWLKIADLFALSSVYEGLPAVVLEALASNCPVVTTDCFVAAREILDKAENCAVIATADAQDLARAMDRSLAGSRCEDLRRIAEKYSLANGISDHLAHIEEVMGVSDGPT